MESKNIVFRGASGTGKSYLAKEIAADIISNGYFDDYAFLTEEQKKQVELCSSIPAMTIPILWKVCALWKTRTIDWQKKESARAGMRRLLKHHRYPPEGMEDAVQTGMSQCEMWANYQV